MSISMVTETSMKSVDAYIRQIEDDLKLYAVMHRGPTNGFQSVKAGNGRGRELLCSGESLCIIRIRSIIQDTPIQACDARLVRYADRGACIGRSSLCSESMITSC